MDLASLLAAVGVGLVFGGIAYWLRVVWLVRVPRQLAPLRIALMAGAALCLAALLKGGAGGGLTPLSGLALAVAASFLALDRIAALPRREPAIAVGQRAPIFTATSSEGERFALDSLRGRPVLLKFFRGHW